MFNKIYGEKLYSCYWFRKDLQLKPVQFNRHIQCRLKAKQKSICTLSAKNSNNHCFKRHIYKSGRMSALIEQKT